MPFLASQRCFWPLTASMTSEVKNDYAHVITQDICNKVIETKKNCRVHGLVVMLTIPRSKVHLHISIVV